VTTGQSSTLDLMAMIERQDRGQPVGVFKAPPEVKGRYFYNETVTGFNFDSRREALPSLFEQIRNSLDGPSDSSSGSPLDSAARPGIYINSLTVRDQFPGLVEHNDLSFDAPVFENNRPVGRIWMGTESTAAAHFDLPDNIACCVHGKRRFTLFPPSQVHNLYPGPLDPTPGGQVVTMTDINNPDFERFPRLKNALDAAIVVDMEPGDALYYPSMWWHQVEAFDAFNVMVNYWWLSAPAYMGNPLDLVLHGILSLRDRPATEKAAWRELMDYYVFGDAERPRAHLPESAQGPLATGGETLARRLRALLRQKLNR